MINVPYIYIAILVTTVVCTFGVGHRAQEPFLTIRLDPSNWCRQVAYGSLELGVNGDLVYLIPITYIAGWLRKRCQISS